MNKMDRLRTSLKIVVSTGILLLAAVLIVQYISLARQNQHFKTDLAQLNNIRYGLLNVDAWNEQVTTIISMKIIELELTPENREALHNSLVKILNRLVDELKVLMETRTSGQFSIMKRWIAGFAFDVEQLRDSIPSYADKMLDELEKPETKGMLQDYLQEKLDDFSAATYSLDNQESLNQVLSRYHCVDKEACKTLLEEKVENRNREINIRVILILLAVTLIFLINLVPGHELNRVQYLLLILASLSLLLGGITTPMIDLEAKIDLLMFQLMGEVVSFSDNIIYFQSKSITDVVRVLIEEGSLQMIFVGILIFTFSIVFPILKLISSWLYTRNRSVVRENRLIRFFVIKSGKWSMADVMVVAIFMAYVGLNGIISNQLEGLGESSELVQVLTTNGTQLLGGFYLFLMFCISSLVLSGVVTGKRA